MKYYYLNEWFEISNNRENVKNQYISLLSQLTTVEDMSVEKFEESIRKICEMGDIVVCVDDQQIVGSNCEASILGSNYEAINQQIVGSGTIIYEPKITHGGKCVGHIEDIITDKNHRGLKIATEIIKKLTESAKAHNCYKVILDCSADMETYYERQGFTKKGAQMAIYF